MRKPTSQERDICTRKHKGNPHSIETFKKLSRNLSRRRKEVFEAIFWSDDRGVTLHEIAMMIDLPVHYVSGRISDLKAQRKIIEIGSRKRGRMPCAVYVAARPRGAK